MPEQLKPDLFSVTEVELIYHNKVKASQRRIVSSAKEAYDLLMDCWEQNKLDLLEQFKIILLDRKNSCIGISNISVGGTSSCVVDPKIVFATALKAKAESIVMAHNHPSGNKLPSESDKKLTKDFVNAGKILQLNVLDHLIITRDGFTSFAEEGLII